MGLDICLARIEDNVKNQHNWLLASDCPELEEKFCRFKKRRMFESGKEDDCAYIYFYSEISYQSKGVKNEFYEIVRDDKCIVTKEEVERLLPFIDDHNREEFEHNFVDKFIEGETIVFIAW